MHIFTRTLLYYGLGCTIYCDEIRHHSMLANHITWRLSYDILPYMEETCIIYICIEETYISICG